MLYHGTEISEMPKDWEEICQSINLPKNFSAWHYFFQNLITQRAQQLIANSVKMNIDKFNADINDSLTNSKKYKLNELDLRQFIWSEDTKDIHRINDRYTGRLIVPKSIKDFPCD